MTKRQGEDGHHATEIARIWAFIVMAGGTLLTFIFSSSG